MPTTDMISALRQTYGAAAEAAQAARYRRALDAFKLCYGPGEVCVFHAPGRVNLIGEHTDYNHGFVLPMALDKDVLLLARPRDDGAVRLSNLEEGYGDRQFEIAQEIPRATLGDWVNYAQGPAQLLEQEYGPGLRGFDGLVDGAPPFGVPRGAGLSSSSALTVATAVALVALNDVDLAGPELADACGRAEWYVGTRGGIMDQFISILARRDHALFLDCRPRAEGDGGYTYDYRHVSIGAGGYAVLVVDSGVRHHNTGPLFNRRVAEGRIGVRLLQRHYPEASITHLRDVQDVPWAELEPLLPEVIHRDELLRLGIDPDTILDGPAGPTSATPDTDRFYVRRRCRHVHSENRRVLASVEALEAGDMAAFGWLLAQAHASARDDYEISIPEIEALVELATIVPGTVGARLTGAGWGGCIVVAVAQEQVEAFSQAVIRGYRRRTGLTATVFPCQSAAGAGLVYRTDMS
jgi:galactokinase